MNVKVLLSLQLMFYYLFHLFSLYVCTVKVTFFGTWDEWGGGGNTEPVPDREAPQPLVMHGTEPLEVHNSIKSMFVVSTVEEVRESQAKGLWEGEKSKGRNLEL